MGLWALGSGDLGRFLKSYQSSVLHDTFLGLESDYMPAPLSEFLIKFRVVV